MSDYSIVVPVYNEEESIMPLYDEITSTMGSVSGDTEIVFVNDYSSDKTTEILEKLQGEDKNVKVITLAKRSGQTFALRKGLDGSSGEIVITMDADLQNDPADIPKILEKMKEGYDCVCGWRKDRQDTLLKACLSKFGNILQRLFTGMKIHDVSCTLRAYKKHCVEKIALNYEGQHRFMPLSLSLQGYKVGEIVSNHRERKFGSTKYNHRRIFKVVVHFFMMLSSRGKK